MRDISSLVALDCLALLVDHVGEGLESWTTILGIVLDAEVLSGAAGVMRGCQEDSAHARDLVFVELTNYVRHCRGREVAILTDDEVVNAVGDRDLNNCLDSF